MLQVVERFYPIADAGINDVARDDNYGGATSIKVGSETDPSEIEYRGLFLFDLTSIPAGAIITTAYFSSYVQESGAPFPKEIFIKRCGKTNWVEGEVTWNSYSTGNAWPIPGGELKIAGKVEWIPPESTEVPTRIYAPNLKAHVVDAITNYSGLLSFGLDSINTGVATVLASSKETAGISQDPYILIYYRVPPTRRGGVPIPAVRHLEGMRKRLSDQVYCETRWPKGRGHR